MSYKYQETDLLIYKAVFGDKWDLVSKTFQDHPELRTKPINRRLETPLMIAVGTNRSHTFVKNLLSSLASDNSCISRALFARNDEGDTALHYAAKVGNMIDAKLLVLDTFKPDMVLNKNGIGNTPLFIASWLGRKNKMLEFLFSEIGALKPRTSEIPIQSLASGDLLSPAIEGEFLDLALELAGKYPGTVLGKTRELQRSLDMLAKKPNLFLSGCRFGFWGHLIYSLLPDGGKIKPEEKTSTRQYVIQDEESIYMATKKICCKSASTVWFKRILQYLASPINNIYDMKITHGQAKQLVKLICEIVLVTYDDQEVVWSILVATIFTAVEYGIYEVIEECILAYPSIIRATSSEEFYLFHSAIRQRREKIYNLIYQTSSYKACIASHVNSEKENALHIAAKLAPPHRLNITTGAGLQMQRELQWFKEIETNFIKAAWKNNYNNKGKTPRMVFTDEHKNLLKEGQDWMKCTASSSTVVATLIVTMAFTVAFAVPGGNKNEGKPVYLDKGAFMLFIVSDAIALFSSATSVLMFLGILTSRYAEEDFLYTLPKRMTIGLFFLFLSLAATLVAFSATLSLVLQDKVTWIAAPLVIITSIPVGLFGVLQFPLLIELVYSTYGPSIFHKQNKRMIH